MDWNKLLPSWMGTFVTQGFSTKTTTEKRSTDEAPTLRSLTRKAPVGARQSFQDSSRDEEETGYYTEDDTDNDTTTLNIDSEDSVDQPSTTFHEDEPEKTSGKARDEYSVWDSWNQYDYKPRSHVAHLELSRYGDVEVVAKWPDIYTTFLVSSHQLCSASSVFRAMLGPNSLFWEAVELRRHQAQAAEAPDEKPEPYRLIIEEKDPIALGAMLCLIHGRPEFVPRKISFKHLVQVAIVCDYYDCTAVMRPWVDMWMDLYRDKANTPGYEDWLFISWVFGVQEIFGELTMKFSKNGVMRNGEFVVLYEGAPPGENTYRLDYHIPQSVIDAMAAQKMSISTKVVEVCLDVFRIYESAPVSESVLCHYNRGFCDYTIFFGLRKGFKKAGLLAEDREEAYSILYPHQILEQIEKIHRYTKPVNGDHFECYLRPVMDLRRRVETLLQGFKPLCLSEFKRESVVKNEDWERILRNVCAAEFA